MEDAVILTESEQKIRDECIRGQLRVREEGLRRAEESPGSLSTEGW